MSQQLDRRRHAYRDDLADARLVGQVTADRFAAGTIHRVRAARAPVYPRPQSGGDLDTEALNGEEVTVFDIVGGWAWGQLKRDGYVGYLRAEMLDAAAPVAATHKIASPAAFAYREPTARSPVVATFFFECRVATVAEFGDCVQIASGGYIGKRHIAPLDFVAADVVATAERFVGTPYLWGGKSVQGIDCSGLVQLSLQAAGIDVPRDTDMQQIELPGDVSIGDDLAGLKRGDLIYWPGHVAIMRDDAIAVHATATHMTTLLEPVCDIHSRARRDGVRLVVKRCGSAAA